MKLVYEDIFTIKRKQKSQRPVSQFISNIWSSSASVSWGHQLQKGYLPAAVQISEGSCALTFNEGISVGNVNHTRGQASAWPGKPRACVIRTTGWLKERMPGWFVSQAHGNGTVGPIFPLSYFRPAFYSARKMLFLLEYIMDRQDGSCLLH